VPCDSNGLEYREADEEYVESPELMIGSNLFFKLKILNCRGLPNKFTVSTICDEKNQLNYKMCFHQDIYCSYKIYHDDQPTVTKTAEATSNPIFNHNKMFSFSPVTKKVGF
jgi:hypothetical protein